jgi:tight adherence protein B
VIDDYNTYKLNKKEVVQYFSFGAFLGAFIGYVFYSSLAWSLLFMLYGIVFVKDKKKELVRIRKWQLNLEFRDGLDCVSSALNAGYSVENAFAQAVKDLKLMYSADSLIVAEFEGIMNQIHMNRNLEEILRDFGNRTQVEDIINFADVFATAKRTGGDIIKIIRSTCNTISDKIEIKREIITLVTGKRFESNIMSLIPLGIILYLKIGSPGFLSPIYHNLFGYIFMTVVLIIYYFAYQLGKRIINIDV